MRKSLTVDILRQPNDTTCGPTCLHSIYRYYGDKKPLSEIIQEVQSISGGGTLGVCLANHALARGYQAKIISYNLEVFDPTWFQPGVDIHEKLGEQIKAKKSKKLKMVCTAYQRFLELGGVLTSIDLQAALIRKYLNRGIPILTGLSATYLYQTKREYGIKNESDDVRGFPAGHFVVFSGYNRIKRKVSIADPYTPNPLSTKANYAVDLNRAMTAILLGVMTYDANFIIITKKSEITRC